MSRFRQCRLLFLLVSAAMLVQWGCRRSDEEDSPSKRLHRARIVLDPGHGGRDGGALARTGQTEKELVLSIALQVERLLKDKGLRVLLTRTSDEYLPLRRRVKLANDDHATLFVSIHANSCGSERVSGFEVYYAESGSESESLEAAGFIQRHFQRATGANDRGIREHHYAVIAHGKCPSVLLEIGYLSNRREAQLLSEPSYRKKVAEGIARGIIAYIRAQH